MVNSRKNAGQSKQNHLGSVLEQLPVKKRPVFIGLKHYDLMFKFGEAKALSISGGSRILEGRGDDRQKSFFKNRSRW